MGDLIKLLGSIIIMVLVLELLDFPQWVAEKLKGDQFRHDTGRKVKELEQRVQQLEQDRESG